jgi:cytochrome c556
MPKKLIALMLLALFLSACGEPEDPRPDKPVAQRRAAFKELLSVFEPMGVMLRTGKYDAKRFQSLSGQLIARRDAPWKHFGADTLYPPSRAKPEVWSDAAKFESHRQAFFDATDKLAGLGGTADKQQAKDAYAAVESSCRNCHKAFKKD